MDEEGILKQVVSVSLGSSADDYEFETEFLGQDVRILRRGVDGDLDEAVALVRSWATRADAIGLGGIEFPSFSGKRDWVPPSKQRRLYELMEELPRRVTTGEKLRQVGHEWALRHVQHKFDDTYFTNARVFFFSGMTNYTKARVLSEWTENLTFGDPIWAQGLPHCLTSLKQLDVYGRYLHGRLPRLPRLARQTVAGAAVRLWRDQTLHQALKSATVAVIPSYGFYDYVEACSGEELQKKIVITSTAYEHHVEVLKQRGVEVIIDTTPKILEQVVGVNVLEALILATLDKPAQDVTKDDLLGLIVGQQMEPRVIYPSGEPRRVKRFAFVIHPLSKEFLKQDKLIRYFSEVLPPPFLDVAERVVAHAPPWVYSKVTGIKSPEGVEAEGWLITVGGTPKQMLSHSPEFTYKRLLQAAKMAKRLGAQVMGLGAFTKVVGDAGVTVAKQSPIPITTGNSYSASGALWAAADASRRLGLLKAEPGKQIEGKAMVIGATGAIGSVCCRLLAYAFKEIYLIDVREARLLALRESITDETPSVQVTVATNADAYLPDMDVIVTATSAAGKKILDIMKVKPGCVITDVARPLDLSPEDVAKRPDVLYVESGEIDLPGEPQLRDIGLPSGVAYACLAETIVLALEGRFENFTLGRNIEWPKVKEIYQMGLKHGMKLAAISGVNGVYTDRDIARVRQLAVEARLRLGLPVPEVYGAVEARA
jgi:predicted amino acid dehydrogenase